jgi:voltage-dependent potassium channel beta subunit
MQYRNLGRSGLKLSTVGLGSYLTIGMHVDDDVAAECLKLGFEAGMNFIDTANAYNRGRAEEALGQLLAEYPRHSYVLATKVWAPMGDGPNDRGLGRKHLLEQCHASLRRLRTDYVDLYQCHRFDPDTPLEETLRTLDDLCRQGKVLFWGVSEWTAAQIAEAQGLCRQNGWQPMTSNQPRYSLMYRYPEREVFPLCLREGIGQVNFSPLAHGVLSGKYKPGAPVPEATRAADPSQNAIMKRLYWGDENLARAQELAGIAADLGVTAGQLALAWCLRQEVLTSVITAATRVEQMKQNLGAADLTVPDDAAAKLDALFPLPDTAPPE